MPLIDIILSEDPAVRNRPLADACRELSFHALLAERESLEQFRRGSDNLYHRVRALFFLSAIDRFHLPARPELPHHGMIPFAGVERLLNRRFDEAVRLFRAEEAAHGPSDAICSTLAAAYQGLAFQTLADQVRASVRGVAGNRWMFRDRRRRRPPAPRPPGTPRPADSRCTLPDPPRAHAGAHGPDALVLERHLLPRHGLSRGRAGPERLDRPRRPRPGRPPATADRSLFPRHRRTGPAAGQRRPRRHGRRRLARGSLRLRHAIISACSRPPSIASGLIPPGLEGSRQDLKQVLDVAGRTRALGIELVSTVNDIPKGSRLAVSTNLLASLIAVCMRATGQAKSLTGALSRRRAAAGRGAGDPGRVAGRLRRRLAGFGRRLARHQADRGRVRDRRATPSSASAAAGSCPRTPFSTSTGSRRAKGLAREPGPGPRRHGPERRADPGNGDGEIPAARAERNGQARQEALGIFDRDRPAPCERGDIRAVGAATTRNFAGPIQTIIPWATNSFTETLIAAMRGQFRRRFLGLLDARRHVRRRHGFIVAPSRKPEAQDVPPGGTCRGSRGEFRHSSAVRHGTGRLRFRHQPPRHAAPIC